MPRRGMPLGLVLLAGLPLALAGCGSPEADAAAAAAQRFVNLATSDTGALTTTERVAWFEIWPTLSSMV